MDQQLKQQRIAAITAIVIVACGIYLLYNHFSNASQFIPKQSIESTPTAVDTSVRNDMVDVQVLFAKKGYDYCEFYDEYKSWEAEANKMDDDYYQEHPDAPGVGARKADKWLDMKVSRWLKKHHLPDSIGTTISIYGAKVCQ